MKCIICAHQTNVEHRGRALNLDLPYRVVVQGAPVEVCPSCGEVYEGLEEPVQTFEVIANWVAQRPGRLGPAEVRFLRNAIGLTRGQLGQLLGVASETISRWENGKQALSQQSELTLRMAILVPAAVLEGVQQAVEPPAQINIVKQRIVHTS